MATKPKYKSDFQKELETHRKPNSTKVVKKEEPKKSNYSPRKTENRNRVGDIYSMFNDFTPKQQEEFLRQLEYSKARDSYAHYLKLCYPDMVFTYFHLYLCKLIEKVVEKIEKGENPRILLSVPPRHGKSMTITETLPSWFIGRNHNKGVILTAYNADLAEQFEDSNRQKTKNFGKQVFGVEVSEQQDNKTLYRLKGKRGGVIGVGINGGLTGNTGSWNLAIIDDPYKNGDEASSKNERDKKDRIFRDSILTRLSGKGSGVIVIMTRWHEEDMIGKLSKEKGWVYINIPCIAEKEDIFLKRVEGQTLCPELGFDSEWAIRTQEAVGKRVWNALYQGHPTTEGGNIVDRKYLKFYNDKSVPAKFDKFTQTWDLSFGDSKNSDPVAGQVWGKVGADHYILKRINKRMDFNATYSMMKIISAQYPMAIKKIVERKANGQAIIDTLQNVVGGIVPFNPTDSKVSRLTSVLPLFVAGNIYLPDESIDPYINDFVEQLIEFPNGKHDDEVDAMTQYLIDDNNFNYGKINFEINEKFSNIRVGFGGKLKSVEGKRK